MGRHALRVRPATPRNADQPAAPLLSCTVAPPEPVPVAGNAPRGNNPAEFCPSPDNLHNFACRAESFFALRNRTSPQGAAMPGWDSRANEIFLKALDAPTADERR